MSRGGKREGAGRPATGRATKVVRVDAELAGTVNHLEDLLDVIEGWREQERTASKTSPRWEKARELLADLERVLAKS